MSDAPGLKYLMFLSRGIGTGVTNKDTQKMNIYNYDKTEKSQNKVKPTPDNFLLSKVQHFQKLKMLNLSKIVF